MLIYIFLKHQIDMYTYPCIHFDLKENLQVYHWLSSAITTGQLQVYLSSKNFMYIFHANTSGIISGVFSGGT